MISIENLVLKSIDYLSAIDEFLELVRSEEKDVLTYFETTLYTAFSYDKGDLVTNILLEDGYYIRFSHERGIKGKITKTKDPNVVIFWLLDIAIYHYASSYVRTNKSKNEDSTLQRNRIMIGVFKRFGEPYYSMKLHDIKTNGRRKLFTSA